MATYDLLDYLPLSYETIDTIRARLDADANAGIATDDERYIDLTVGGFYFDVTQGPALEIERLWDMLLNEVPAAALPSFAWGQYLDWQAETYGLTRKDASKAAGEVTFTGTEGTLIPTSTSVSTEAPTPDDDPIEFLTTASGTIPVGGTLVLAVEAAEAGVNGNVGVGAITILLSPLSGIASVSNTAAMSGGADVETDEDLHNRIDLELASPQGAGNQSDYERWALAYSGVGHASVEPLWAGAGTVRVMVTDNDNNPVAQAVIDGLQDVLDPVAGEGQGLAPIGAIVTVATPTLDTVTAAATISFLAGYSLDGAGGTIACRDAIEAAIETYINGLSPGDDVVIMHARATCFQVAGVYDVTAFTLNGAGTNVVIAADHLARAGTITLT